MRNTVSNVSLWRVVYFFFSFVDYYVSIGDEIRLIIHGCYWSNYIYARRSAALCL